MNVMLWIFGSLAAVAILFVAAAGTYAVLKGRSNEFDTRRDENGNVILLDSPGYASLPPPRTTRRSRWRSGDT